MNIAIVLFPGSNCANDMELFFKSKGHNCFYIWHKEEDINKFNFDLLILPGGFSFGDRVYKKATSSYSQIPGEMAIKSPVCKIIREASANNVPIIGVCNGFQILIKMGLLPGELERNINKKFTCKNILCKIKLQGNNFDKKINIDVANEFGKYIISLEEYRKMQTNNQILIKYCDNYIYENGSIFDIAGVCNKEKTIFGMMPHFERNLSDDNILYQVIMETIQKNNNISKSVEDLMFSEHISYKSTKKYLKQLYTEGTHVVQGPGENAGIVDIGDGYCIAIRIESHNHPTFIDPFRGASTGVGGILRDIFTMGAKPIGILDFLRFGCDENSNYLLDKTVEGIAYYGNCFGVANIGGNCYIDHMFNKNPLVNIACLGIVKKDNIIFGNVLNEDSILIYVGSKTGNEGINGAAMASQSFSENMNTDEMKKNIQTGDAFLEKLLLEACLELSEQKLAEGMQDMGAGGVLCATLEVVQRGRNKTNMNYGCDIFVNNIPTKHKMNNCDKLISESQERMLIVARPENKEKIYQIFEKWDLEYSHIGNVNNSGKYVVKCFNSIIYEKNINSFEGIQEDWPITDFNYKNFNNNLYNNQELWNTYDSTIGCRTVENNRNSCSNSNNFSIINIYEINKQLIISWGPDFDSCYKSIVNKNYKPLGLVNCLNYGHPNDSMGELKLFLEKLTEKCNKYKIPVLGGNVSLYNATNNASIDPCPILVMIGIN